jgi:hypothetical protein
MEIKDKSLKELETLEKITDKKYDKNKKYSKRTQHTEIK